MLNKQIATCPLPHHAPPPPRTNHAHQTASGGGLELWFHKLRWCHSNGSSTWFFWAGSALEKIGLSLGRGLLKSSICLISSLLSVPRVLECSNLLILSPQTPPAFILILFHLLHWPSFSLFLSFDLSLVLPLSIYSVEFQRNLGCLSVAEYLALRASAVSLIWCDEGCEGPPGGSQTDIWHISYLSCPSALGAEVEGNMLVPTAGPPLSM